MKIFSTLIIVAVASYALPAFSAGADAPACGVPITRVKRVIGGSDAQLGEFPWQVALGVSSDSVFSPRCGAVLLNQNWALTSQHCLENVTLEDLLLRFGENDLATEKEAYPYKERKIGRVVSHPLHVENSLENDLVLLQFAEPITFQANILPVCLPEANEDFEGELATVTGWGRTSENGTVSVKLQKAQVPVLSNTNCEAMIKTAGHDAKIPKIFVCAGRADGQQDACSGDTGSPLVVRKSGRWVVIGTVAWGFGCGRPNSPGVYTRITEYVDWINEVIG